MPKPSFARSPTDRLERRARARLRTLVQACASIPTLSRRLRGRAEIECAFVSATVMRGLNRDYRGVDAVTDILSFEPPPNLPRASGASGLGELVLCRAVLRRQASEQSHSETFELDVLLTHGVLHLLGFDHERSEREAARMRSFEARLLAALRPGRAEARARGRTQAGQGLIARAMSLRARVARR